MDIKKLVLMVACISKYSGNNINFMLSEYPFIKDKEDFIESLIDLGFIVDENSRGVSWTGDDKDCYEIINGKLIHTKISSEEYNLYRIYQIFIKMIKTGVRFTFE